MVNKPLKNDKKGNGRLEIEKKSDKYKNGNVKSNRTENKDNRNNNSNNQNGNSNLLNNNNILDNINIKIIHELLINPTVKSATIAEKINVPQSTIQRRRSRLEETILKRNYNFDLYSLGFRSAYLFVNVKNGKAEDMGYKLLKNHSDNILKVSTRINTDNNLCLEIIFDTSEELHKILEEIKSDTNVDKVEWSELVSILGDNTVNVVNKLLTQKQKHPLTNQIS